MSLPSTAIYIPLKTAVEKYGIPKKTLLDQIKSGRIASAQLPDGDLLVAENDIDPSLNIKREDFEHLREHPIGVAEAGRKYGLNDTTISKWSRKGYIRVLVKAKTRGQKKLLDEADIAYCAAVYKAKYDFYDGQMAGVNIFDDKGNPYKVKYREIAAQMRENRRRQRQEKG